MRVRTFSDTSAAADAEATSRRTPDGPEHRPRGRPSPTCSAEDRPQGQAVVAAQRRHPQRRRRRSTRARRRPPGQGAGRPGLHPHLRRRRRRRSTSPSTCARRRTWRSSARRSPSTVRVAGRGVKGGQGRRHAALRRQGSRPAAGRPRPAPAAPEVRFWVTQDKTGLYPYEARVDPLPGEATQANNSATYLLRVIDQPVRVLLVEGKPYWDSKFLVRTLVGVPAVELDSVVRVADGRLMRRTIARKEPSDAAPGAAPTTVPADVAVAAAVPPPRRRAGEPSPDAVARTETRGRSSTTPANVLASAERLQQYQIVVLGREAEAFLTDAAVANLQNWVSQDGGALVCSRGSPTAQVNQRLARLLPVKWTPAREARFRMRLTDEGRDLHWLGDGAAARTAGSPACRRSPAAPRSTAPSRWPWCWRPASRRGGAARRRRQSPGRHLPAVRHRPGRRDRRRRHVAVGVPAAAVPAAGRGLRLALAQPAALADLRRRPAAGAEDGACGPTRSASPPTSRPPPRCWSARRRPRARPPPRSN